MEDVAINVENISKSFKLPHDKYSSIKSLFVNFYKSRQTFEIQQALSNLSFEVKKGEFVGIVGRNGSGKSTLLKIIAGIYAPTKGRVEVNGSLTPFIELGVGFNPELTGRENVYLNGALLGLGRKQMRLMYKDIVEFAELERFMDLKLKNYSSGMQVRLAFSIAIRAQSDILLLDEVLAVGDSAFQKKCNDYFYKLKSHKQTVVLVTHNMGAVEQFCDRAIIVDGGKILQIGDPSSVVDLYNELNLKSSIINQKDISEATEQNIEDAVKLPANIVKVETYNAASQHDQSTFTFAEKIGVRYKIEVHEDLVSPTVGLVFKDRSENKVFATNTPSMNFKLKDVKKNDKLIVEFEIDNVFDNGIYYISGALSSRDRSEVYHKVNNARSFEIGGWKFPESIAHPQHQIKVTYK